MKKFLFIFLISIPIVSCGQKGQQSKTKFKILSGKLTATAASFPGGLLLYGRSLEGAQSFIVPYKPELELVLVKGSWEFAIIGWMGPNPLEGHQQCSYQKVEINSEFYTINLNVNNEDCLNLVTENGNRLTDPIFYNLIGGTFNGFKKLQVRTCGDLDNCTAQVKPFSYKVEIPSSFKGIAFPAGFTHGLHSKCITSLTANNIALPYGGENGFIGLKISVYNTAFASFNSPVGLAVGPSGYIYVADTDNHTIRKITPDGIVTTLAGVAGSIGSIDGIGSVAKFFSPVGIAVDSLENIYVTESGNHTIRKITPSGVVTTVAGKALSFGDANGIASEARFYSPEGITVDSAGNLYVTEYFNHTIRKISFDGIVTTFAGLSGAPGNTDGKGVFARFNNPRGLAIDAAHNLYVVDSLNYTIRKIKPDGGVSTIAGTAGVMGNIDGIGAAARFKNPSSLALDFLGNIYISDSGNHSMRMLTPKGEVSTIAGLGGMIGSHDGNISEANFNYPYGVGVDSSGIIYVADTDNKTIRKISSEKIVSTFAGVAGIQGQIDGAVNAEGCTGTPKKYFFKNGFGKAIHQSFVKDGITHSRRGALSVDINSIDASIALSPIKFLGAYSNFSAVPELVGTNDLYIYKGALNMLVFPYTPVESYLYYNGSTWITFPETDSVKLLLQD
jgi:sugar lactone lactonase YvrE